MDNMENSLSECVKAEISQQSERATIALKDYVEKNNADKKFLFPETNTGVSVLVTYKRIPLAQPRYRTLVRLPYSERTPDNTNICLILPDISRAKEAKVNVDVEAESRRWLEILQRRHKKINLEQITKVITLTQLRREYRMPESKKKLANSYDLFLIEAKIMPIVITFVGQHFMNSTKRPLPIHVNRKCFLNELASAYDTISLPLEQQKDTVSVRIGNLEQSAFYLHANICALADKLVAECPGQALNIRSVHLKAANVNVSLPLYVDFGSPNDVKFEQPPPLWKRRGESPPQRVFTDECSTLSDGLSVKVHVDGNVAVIDEKTGEEVGCPILDERVGSKRGSAVVKCKAERRKKEKKAVEGAAKKKKIS